MSKRQDRASLQEAYESVNEMVGGAPIIAVTGLDPQQTNKCGCGSNECDCDSHGHGGEEHDNSEIHMAKAELKKAADYATQLSAILDNLDGLEGWTASKITKAADYLSSVYHWLDYDANQSQDPGMFNVGCEHSPEYQDRP
jgi:hypothetical protein